MSKALALGGASLALSSAVLASLTPTAALAASACGAGATLISPGICEVKFDAGTHTFTPPAGITKLDALIVGAGGDGYAAPSGVHEAHAYGGGGGEVKVVHLAATGNVTVVVNPNSVSSGTSTTTQGGTTDTSEGGRAPGMWRTGQSGSGGVAHYGNISGGSGINSQTIYYSGGGGAGGNSLSNSGAGGPGITVSDIAAGSLFAHDTDCYGGGGGVGVYDPDWRAQAVVESVPVCNGGFVGMTTEPTLTYFVSSNEEPPLSGSGSGGFGEYVNLGGTQTHPSPYQGGWSYGATGTVILRFDATVAPTALPDTGISAIAISAGAGLAGTGIVTGALMMVAGLRRRKA